MGKVSLATYLGSKVVTITNRSNRICCHAAQGTKVNTARVNVARWLF